VVCRRSSSQRAIDVLEDDARLIVVAPVYEVGLVIRALKFRMGINVGDIIIEDGDIFGDGVNVAARLEALAELGGICVCRVVRDQVRDKLDFAVDDMGEQQVKNIARSPARFTDTVAVE
jgi:class 3 adenylate cyclase